MTTKYLVVIQTTQLPGREAFLGLSYGAELSLTTQTYVFSQPEPASLAYHEAWARAKDLSIPGVTVDVHFEQEVLS